MFLGEVRASEPKRHHGGDQDNKQRVERRDNQNQSDVGVTGKAQQHNRDTEWPVLNSGFQSNGPRVHRVQANCAGEAVGDHNADQSHPDCHGEGLPGGRGQELPVSGNPGRDEVHDEEQANKATE